MPIPDFLQPLQNLLLAVTPGMAPSASPVGGASAASRSLGGFSMQTQSETEWCWAAVSTSVAVFFGSTNWTQCKVAVGELSPLDCCGADASTGCNIPWYLDAPLARVGHFNRMNNSSSLFTDIQTEINGGRPLCGRIAWVGGGAHFVVLGGWSIAADGTEYVDVYDSYYGFIQKTYIDFAVAYRATGDTWTHSYLTLSGPAAVAGGAAPSANSPKSV